MLPLIEGLTWLLSYIQKTIYAKHQILIENLTDLEHFHKPCFAILIENLILMDHVLT